MKRPAIVADGLTKRFGSLTAVRDLRLTVDPGQIMGFLGPNGAGKTTTIRMMLGFLKPTAGAATVLGTSLARAPRMRRRVGYLPGDLRIEAGMTGRELFAFFGRLRGGLRQGRVDELVQRLDLDPGRPFGTLSKGNRQKVGIVQALCHDPDVLILDEPTTGLDPLVQREFLTLLREAAYAGAAVLFSSHVLPEVERVATRVAIIRAGRLVREASIDELLDRARRTLEVRFADSAPPGLFAGVAGVVGAEYDGHTATVTVDGPVGPALRAATEVGTVLRVNPVGDDLEDLFLSFYDRNHRSAGVA